MRLISWNTNRRTRLAGEQARIILSRGPDLVCLQEITDFSIEAFRTAFSAGGLGHIGTTVDPQTAKRRGPRAFGVLVASKFPLLEDRAISFALPWEEKAISVVVRTPHGDVELHNVHIPPGSSNGWMKVEILEAVFAALSRRAHERPALLCGDFNTPQCELSSGEIVTWAQRIDPSGRICLKARIRRGPGDRWDAAERNILSGLRQFGFRDVYRDLHGYAINAPSWVLKRKGVLIGRRFDHLFASDHLKVARCAYLDEWRLTGLSDHSALETEVDLLGSDSWQTSTIPSSLASPTDAV